MNDWTAFVVLVVLVAASISLGYLIGSDREHRRYRRIIADARNNPALMRAVARAAGDEADVAEFRRELDRLEGWPR